MKKISLVIILFCYTVHVSSQQFWSKRDVTDFQKSVEEVNTRKSEPTSYDIYDLQLNSLSSFLKNSTDETILELPDGRGKLKRFNIRSSSNFAPELAAKFPMIHSYTGYGIDDPTAMAKIDIGTKGFHAVVFSGNHSTIYIDPHTKDGNSCMVYRRKDLNPNERDFMCHVEEGPSSFQNKAASFSSFNADDGMLRTFRLAIVCTGEYAQFHLNDQGVSSGATDAVKKAAVLSAMNTTMNRVNGVYEIDLGVRMEIVANNDQIIYLDAATDGLDNANPVNLLDQSQSVCDSEIGTANYDIGHIFSTQGGGIAQLASICSTGSKARGVTGIGVPMNDPYDIDFVSHEIGHQFGANHTQNNECQRNFSTAVEPGSASTIMGYAGICPPNVQGNSDDHFNAVNIAEMWNVLQSSGNCAVQTSAGNSAPTADAGADFSIPASTPFVLRGTATDVDGLSSLTYNWEQIDNIPSQMPPEPTNTQGPMFRSLSSKTVPERYMPEISTVIAGNTSNTWEVLPSVARELNFAFTVRDNHPGGGNTARDNKVVTVINSPPFVVTFPNTPLILQGNTTQTIQWNVRNTDVAPINCQLVNIKLSTDGGQTFPTTIVANTPNDGTQEVVIPNTPTATARIMVEAADNIFYNMSQSNFIIEAGTASVDENTLSNFAMYPNPTQSLVNISFDANNGNEVHVQLYDLRGRSVKRFFYTNTVGRFSEVMSVNSISSGVYLVRVQNGNKSIVKKLIVE